MKQSQINAEDSVCIFTILDEDFVCMMRMARGITETFLRPKDREVSNEILNELTNFNRVNSLTVKQSVATFLRFFLKVLHWTKTHQPETIYKQWYGANSRSISIGGASGLETTTTSNETRTWLVASKSFMAMKSFEDGSTIIYSAVAKDPNAGWTEHGIRELASREGGECCLNKSLEYDRKLILDS